MPVPEVLAGAPQLYWEGWPDPVRAPSSVRSANKKASRDPQDPSGRYPAMMMSEKGFDGIAPT